MKILIISDTHRDLKNFFAVLKREEPIDMCLHLGDVEADASIIQQTLECPLHMVKGNNDFFGLLPEEIELKIGKHKVFMTHGHRYMVSLGGERLLDEALHIGADIVIHGHTHKPMIKQENGITLLCPGSISYPRQSGRKFTYIIMEMDENERLRFEIKHYSREDK